MNAVSCAPANGEKVSVLSSFANVFGRFLNRTPKKFEDADVDHDTVNHVDHESIFKLNDPSTVEFNPNPSVELVDALSQAPESSMKVKAPESIYSGRTLFQALRSHSINLRISMGTKINFFTFSKGGLESFYDSIKNNIPITEHDFITNEELMKQAEEAKLAFELENRRFMTLHARVEAYWNNFLKELSIFRSKRKPRIRTFTSDFLKALNAYKAYRKSILEALRELPAYLELENNFEKYNAVIAYLKDKLDNVVK